MGNKQMSQEGLLITFLFILTFAFSTVFDGLLDDFINALRKERIKKEETKKDDETK